jgi:hypothetical protein
MRTANTGLKTIEPMPVHGMDGAIAATVTMKTNPKLLRRARRWKAEASATSRLKTRRTVLKPASRGWLTNSQVEST